MWIEKQTCVSSWFSWTKENTKLVISRRYFFPLNTEDTGGQGQEQKIPSANAPKHKQNMMKSHTDYFVIIDTLV